MLKPRDTLSAEVSGLTQRELITYATLASSFVTCQRWEPCVVSKEHGHTKGKAKECNLRTNTRQAPENEAQGTMSLPTNCVFLAPADRAFKVRNGNIYGSPCAVNRPIDILQKRRR